MSTPRIGLMVGLTAGVIMAIAFFVGFVAGASWGHQNQASVESSDPNVRDFVAAYQLVTSQSFYRPFNRHQLIYAAIDGMLNATGDPHTIFLSPSENKTASQQLDGSQFTGIGAIVQPNKGSLEVLSPVPGEPAARAGIHAGDRIIAIDGLPASRLSGDDRVARIHGKPGSVVRLSVRRGGRTFVVAVTRAIIPPITAYGENLPGHLGYVRILSFGDGTSGEVARSLEQLRAAHITGVIVDLRQNPGGYVQAAQNIVSDFLSAGVVAYEKRDRNNLVPLRVIAGRQIVRVPIAVVVDDGTASAAEITAAALRDDGNAVLIGTRTYGKGSMQSVYSLSDGSTVRITDRLWLTPRKQSISGVGLRPSISVAVKLTSGDASLTLAEQYLLHHQAP